MPYKLVGIHIGLVLALVVVGYLINGLSKPYEGYVTSFTAGLSAYVTVINILYNKNQKVYLAINRLKMLSGNTHTLWQIDFQFDLRRDQFQFYEDTLDSIEKSLRSSNLGEIRLKDKMGNKLELVLEEQIGLAFRVDEKGVHLNFDPKLQVPSRLYDRRVRLLRTVCESVVQAIKPIKYRFTLEVFFRDGVTNPYYGYFVRKIPLGSLQDFRVVVRLDDSMDCKLRVATDHVSVEATKITEGFDALSNVLRLKPLLQGSAS